MFPDMAQQYRHPQPRFITFHHRLVVSALAGALTTSAACIAGTLTTQIAFLGIGFSILAGLIATQIQRKCDQEDRPDCLPKEFRAPLSLVHQSELFGVYRGLVAAITNLASQTDCILREAALVKLAVIHEELASLARGQIVFSATQAWRVPYEQILTSPGIGNYRSVAWLQDEDYWQDEPGRQ